ncbi:MAG: penicillin-binding protein 2 [Acidobacteria bacterium]|nr:penicillin-binding protein 2 [Acidobacteriota bacterium]
MDYRERWELKDYLIGRRLERRILTIHVAYAVVLAGFVLNFWYLQGVHGEEYALLAENNRMRRVEVFPTRGVIYDRSDRVVASTRPSLTLWMTREDGRDLGAQLERLAPILSIPLEQLKERLKRMRGRPLFEQFQLEEDVSLVELAHIEARRELFPSVSVRETARRHYPEGEMIAHAIGYVAQVNESELSGSDELLTGDIVGKSGIERTLDGRLRGDRGWELVSVNSLGRQIGTARIETEPNHGQSLHVTLDLEMQRTLYEGFGEEAGGAIFLDVETGGVLALVSRPSFDPNLFADGFTTETWKSIIEDPRRPLHNRAISSLYAPGSTFKVVLAVAGLETGTVDPSYRIFCNGGKSYYKRRRLCWKRGGHGWVDMRKALAQSCNVYFYDLGQKLGIDKIHEYGKIFGFGRPTGIDIPGEEAGILPSREWKRRELREIWYPGDTISVSIGQGYVAVTPAQLATMMAAIARGTAPIPPRLVDGPPPPVEPLAVSERTLRIVREALKQAVEEGTGRAATLGAFSVAGKTGTAQLTAGSAGVDSADLAKAIRDHAWFVGYAPAENPTIAFAIIVEHGGHGGSMAAPIARKVLEVYFRETTDTGTGVRRASLPIPR